MSGAIGEGFSSFGNSLAGIIKANNVISAQKKMQAEQYNQQQQAQYQTALSTDAEANYTSAKAELKALLSNPNAMMDNTFMDNYMSKITRQISSGMYGGKSSDLMTDISTELSNVFGKTLVSTGYTGVDYLTGKDTEKYREGVEKSIEALNKAGNLYTKTTTKGLGHTGEGRSSVNVNTNVSGHLTSTDPKMAYYGGSQTAGNVVLSPNYFKEVISKVKSGDMPIISGVVASLAGTGTTGVTHDQKSLRERLSKFTEEDIDQAIKTFNKDPKQAASIKLDVQNLIQSLKGGTSQSIGTLSDILRLPQMKEQKSGDGGVFYNKSTQSFLDKEKGKSVAGDIVEKAGLLSEVLGRDNTVNARKLQDLISDLSLVAEQREKEYFDSLKPKRMIERDTNFLEKLLGVKEFDTPEYKEIKRKDLKEIFGTTEVNSKIIQELLERLTPLKSRLVTE